MSEGEVNSLKPFDANTTGDKLSAIVVEIAEPIYDSPLEKSNADLATLNIQDAKEIQTQQENNQLTLSQVEVAAGNVIVPYFPDQVSGYGTLFSKVTDFLNQNKDTLKLSGSTFNIVLNGEIKNGIATPTPLPEEEMLTTVQISSPTKTLVLEPQGDSYTMDGVKVSYNYPILEALGMADSAGNALVSQDVIGHVYPLFVKNPNNGADGMEAVFRDDQGNILHILGTTYYTVPGPEGLVSFEWNNAEWQYTFDTTLNDLRPLNPEASVMEIVPSLAHGELAKNYIGTASFTYPNGEKASINILGDIDNLTKLGYPLYKYTEASRPFVQEFANNILLDTPNQINVLSINKASTDNDHQPDAEGHRDGEEFPRVNLNNITVILVDRNLPELVTPLISDGPNGKDEPESGYFIEPRTDGRLVIYLNLGGLEQYLNENKPQMTQEIYPRSIYYVMGIIRRFQSLDGKSYMGVSSAIAQDLSGPIQPWTRIPSDAKKAVNEVWDKLIATLEPVNDLAKKVY